MTIPQRATPSLASLNDANFSLERGHSISVLAALDPQRAANWLTSPSNSRAFYPVLGHILSGTIAKEWARPLRSDPPPSPRPLDFSHSKDHPVVPRLGPL